MKIKANRGCDGAHDLDVYLDGKKLDRCYEADEAEGVAWVSALDESGQPVGARNALPGDFVMGELVVRRLTGKVEIRVDLPDHLGDREQIRRRVMETYQPVSIHQVVQ